RRHASASLGVKGIQIPELTVLWFVVQLMRAKGLLFPRSNISADPPVHDPYHILPIVARRREHVRSELRVVTCSHRGRGALRGRGGALVGVVISAPASAAPPAPPPPPPPASLLPAPLLGPGRAPAEEHCYRCLQAPGRGGGAPLPFCNGYSQNGAKCLRCRALHQPCQSFPAAALPEANAIITAQVTLEVTHPRVAGLALEAVTHTAQAFRARVTASGGPLPRGAAPASAPVAPASSPTPPFVSAPRSPMAAPAPAGLWAATVQFFSG
ncbi:hypothetical protein GB937_009059, partial [Aspergillus fischeri]